MTIQLVTAPTYLPVSLAEARAWCRLESGNTDHDTVLTLLIGAMVQRAELLTGRAFMERTLRLISPGWPSIEVNGYCGTGFELPQPPLVAVDSIQYYDEDGTLQTLAASQYVVHAWREPAFVIPAWQVSWPAVRGLPNAVQVNYRAGYPAAGSPADAAAQQAGQPANLKTWINARLATLFENREQLVVGTVVNALPYAHADGLLDDLVLGERLGR